jgi:hypothetical protein
MMHTVPETIHPQHHLGRRVVVPVVPVVLEVLGVLA